MPAITSTIVALGGLALTAGQAYNSAQNQKDADQAATIAKNRMDSIKAENKYKALQAPDVSGIAFDRNAQATADTIEALKDMGPEGAAQATNIEKASRESNLAAAEKQGQINYNRDQLVAQQDQNIEDSRVDRESYLAWKELEGAQLASSDAKADKNAAITGVVSGVGNVAAGLGDAFSLEAKAQRAKRRAGRSDSTLTKSDPTLTKRDAYSPGEAYSTGVNDPEEYFQNPFAMPRSKGFQNPWAVTGNKGLVP